MIQLKSKMLSDGRHVISIREKVRCLCVETQTQIIRGLATRSAITANSKQANTKNFAFFQSQIHSHVTDEILKFFDNPQPHEIIDPHRELHSVCKFPPFCQFPTDSSKTAGAILLHLASSDSPECFLHFIFRPTLPSGHAFLNYGLIHTRDWSPHG